MGEREVISKGKEISLEGLKGRKDMETIDKEGSWGGGSKGGRNEIKILERENDWTVREMEIEIINQVEENKRYILKDMDTNVMIEKENKQGVVLKTNKGTWKRLGNGERRDDG